MATSSNSHDAAAATAGSSSTPAAAASQFQVRRSELLVSISASLENVLQQVNGLNRTLEGIIEIGNEFGSVEALWSQFESVMGKTSDGRDGGDGPDGRGEEEEEEEEEQDDVTEVRPGTEEEEETEQMMTYTDDDVESSEERRWDQDRLEDGYGYDDDDPTVRLKSKGKQR